MCVLGHTFNVSTVGKSVSAITSLLLQSLKVSQRRELQPPQVLPGQAHWSSKVPGIYQSFFKAPYGHLIPKIIFSSFWPTSCLPHWLSLLQTDATLNNYCWLLSTDTQEQGFPPGRSESGQIMTSPPREALLGSLQTGQ